MRSPHVADLAAAYALGALSDEEMAAVNAHLTECGSCLRAIGSAEDDVTRVAATEPRSEPPAGLDSRVARAFAVRPIGPSAALLAAAFVLGLLPSTYFWSQSQALHGAMAAQGEALDRLAAATHRSVDFRTAPGNPSATVSYGPDGTWYVIVVRDTDKTLGVAWMHDGTQTMLGKVVPHGHIAMLYLPKSHRMGELALVDGLRIIARAKLSWGRTNPVRQGDRSA